MGKDPSRKPPKRKPIEPVVDADLAELAAVIAEHKLEINSRGWLALPWRSGWNVARLVVAMEARTFNGDPSLQGLIQSWIDRRPDDLSLIYRMADEKRAATNRALLVTALRAIQLDIARSAGDGSLYNDLLRRHFDDLFRRELDFVEPMLNARCHDAIGTMVYLRNDQHDRKRRAFKTAWERGLYHAAYAIGPVK